MGNNKKHHEKLIDHNLIITRADKGKTLVILPQNKYNNKVMNLIITVLPK
jgi:hypothetical protein